MNLGIVKNTMSTYTPPSVNGQGNLSEIESKLDALKKKLQDVKQNENLEPEKKKKQIQDIMKKIIELEKRIAQMKQKKNQNEQQMQNDLKEELNKNRFSNNLLDEYV